MGTKEKDMRRKEKGDWINPLKMKYDMIFKMSPFWTVTPVLLKAIMPILLMTVMNQKMTQYMLGVIRRPLLSKKRPLLSAQ